MTLSVGNRLVKRRATYTPNQDGQGFTVEHGEPITDESEVNVEYEITDLHTSETNEETGLHEVSARLRQVR